MPRRNLIVCFALGLILCSFAFADRGLPTRAVAFVTLAAEYQETVSDRILPQLLELGLDTAGIDAIIEDAAISVTGCVFSKVHEPTFRYRREFVTSLARSDGVADAIASIQLEFGEEAAMTIAVSLSSVDSQCMSDMLAKRKLK